MGAATVVVGLALGVEVGAAPVMAAQARAADLVTAARAQLGAGNVDSALVLIGLALDSSTVATGRDHVNALVWRGVLQFFKGRDSLAHESFRDALTLDPRLEVAGLVQIDSLLAAEFEAVRRSVQPPPRETLVDHVRPARFSPGRVQGRAVRVVMQWRLTLRSR